MSPVNESIVDMAHIDGVKMELQLGMTDMHEIVTDLEQLWRPTLENKGVAFTCFVENGLSDAVIMDQTRFRQCLNNLLSNAVKFTNKGRVHLHVTSSPIEGSQDIKISAIVADTGQGIQEDAKADIFNPLVQGNAADDPGLGLTITRNLAQMMGGDVTFISKANRGSEFTLTVRAERSEEAYVLDEMEALLDSVNTTPPSPETKNSKQPVKTERAAKAPNTIIRTPKDGDDFDPDNIRGLKVLIVEDIPANQDVIKLFLNPEGCESFCALNGHEALKVLDTQEIDVIIMDIRMPEMDGIEATRAIRQSDKAYRNIPIIALTADAAANTNAECMAAGADIFLTKPVMARDLTEAIRFLRRFQESEDTETQMITA